MKVKHLLFSSLFLSAGFAACTSDVEEFNTQAPVTNPNGIELGEGFSFTVTNAGFGADADTRAHFDKEGSSWIPSWDNTDKVGAALYSMVTGMQPSPNEDKVLTAHSFLFTNGFYASNNEFAYAQGEGGAATFTSATNSMVGAYLLYYPYNINLNKQTSFNQIPVYSEEKATSQLKFDATDIEKEVNERIFAATIAEFEDNTNNAPTFQLQQIPNLYMIKFALADKLLLTLENPIKIQKIIMEAKTSSGSAINVNGIVKPVWNNPEAKRFNNDYIDELNPAAGRWNLGGIRFDADDSKYTASNLTITPEHVADDSELNIKVLGKEARTAPYYFSALPLDAGVESIAFTIVADVDGVDKVFTKEFTESDPVMEKVSNVLKPGTTDQYYDNWDLLTMRAEGMGEVINLGVVLDSQVESGAIYTISQFEDRWNQGQTSFIFNVAGLDFSELEITEFTSAKGDIVFDGAEQKLVQNIKTVEEGSFTFKNAITIEGDVTATATKDITFEENALIDGDVIADNAIITFKKEAQISGDVKTLNGGKVIFKGNASVKKSAVDATDGIIDVAADTEVSFAAKAEFGSLNSAGTVTFAGQTYGGNITTTGGKFTISYVATGANDIPTVGTINATNTTVDLKKAKTGAISAVNSTITTAVGSEIDGNVDVKGEEGAQIIKLNGVVKGNVTAEQVKIQGVSTITGNVDLKAATSSSATLDVDGTISVDAYSDLDKGTVTAGTLTVYGSVIGTAVKEIGTLNVMGMGLANIKGSGTKAKIENVMVEKINTKAGTLIANNITLGNVENAGVIEGTFTVAGTFNQNGTADAAEITVNEEAVLNVNVNMTTAGITNNGTVNILAKKTLSGIITNNAVINVNGILTETAADDLTMGADAEIYVNRSASLTYNTSSANKDGIVYIVKNIGDVPAFGNASGQQKVVAYKWSTTAPDNTIFTKYNRICVDGATVVDATKQYLDGKAVCLYAGGMKINSSTAEFEITGTLIVKESASITTTNNTLKIFKLTTANNYVAEGQIFTLDDKMTLNGAGATTLLKLLKDAKFEGNVGANVTVQHVASL